MIDWILKRFGGEKPMTIDAEQAKTEEVLAENVARVSELEREKNELYCTLLLAREEQHMDRANAKSRDEQLQERIGVAYQHITGRGFRRAQRDPVYALVRNACQRLATREGVEFERLRHADFMLLIEEHPQYADRLNDIAFEFGVYLTKAWREQTDAQPPAETSRPEASA